MDTDLNNLIAALIANPAKFNHAGRANDIAQCYWQGSPLGTLIPLLRHRDVLVRQAAAYVASELGVLAEPLVRDVIPLIQDQDLHTRWHALETVAVCSTLRDPASFVHVIREFENDAGAIRRLAMRLTAKSTARQLEETQRAIDPRSPSGVIHSTGLVFLRKCETVPTQIVLEMIRSDEAVTRKYGAIAAMRLINTRPVLLAEATLSIDDDIRVFATDRIQGRN